MAENIAINELSDASKSISRLIGKTLFSDSPEDQALLDHLFQARDQINAAAQQLIASDLATSIADCQDDLRTLSSGTTALQGVASAVKSADAVLGIVNQIAEAVSSLLTKLVA
jgi:hypothetical protein